MVLLPHFVAVISHYLLSSLLLTPGALIVYEEKEPGPKISGFTTTSWCSDSLVQFTKYITEKREIVGI